MALYETAQICLNGHVISYESDGDEKCCSKCGSKTIRSCQKCGTKIRGCEIYDFPVVNIKYVTPKYCPNCGSPYPWTSAAIEATKIMLEESEEINATYRDRLIESLPDIVSETPKTSLAVNRANNVLKSVGKFTADALREFVITFGCELAKSQLGM